MKISLKRDDGQELDLSNIDGIYLTDDDEWFDAKSLRSSTWNYQRGDGGQLSAQYYDMYPFTVSGYIRRGTVQQAWEVRNQMFRFFQKNHYYQVIITRCDGVQMANSTVFISQPLQVVQQGKSDLFMSWNIQLTLADPYWYQYETDDEGNEVYANVVTIQKVASVKEGSGYSYIANGYRYVQGGYMYMGAEPSVIPTIELESQSPTLPVWTVLGPAKNPTITNLTTNESTTWEGTLAEGQTLEVNMNDHTAYIGTADVSNYISGYWMSLQPGTNQMKFTSDDENDVRSSTLSYNGVVF